MNWKNKITELLHIDYPIVQAPMLGVSTPEMAAQISNAGGLGSLAVGGLSPQKTTELIRHTQKLTDKPFAVNLFAHNIPEVNGQQVIDMKTFLLQLCAKYELPFEEKDFAPFEFHSYEEQLSILIEERVPIVSFTFGIPDDAYLKQLRDKDIRLIGTATSVAEAVLLDEKGIDIITAQGIEAGGHRGSFLDKDRLPQVGLFTLLTGIRERSNTPVLAAGGICDARSIAAALMLGAKGVQLGTAFIASDESAAIPSYKARLRQAADTDSMLTRTFSGRWARGLSNDFMQEVEQSGLEIPAYPIQNSLTAKLRALAQQRDNSALTNLWAGQAANKAEPKPAATIFKDLIKQTEELAYSRG